MQAAARLNSPKLRILIVEDEPSVAMTMRFLLGLAGCEAEIAATKAKAIQMAQSGSFHLITLDINLQGANGYEVCRELKENPRLRDTPIVFVSGNCCLEDQQRGLDVGAVDYITKPFETFEFAPRLLSHIKSSRALDVPDEIADADAEGFCNSTQGNQ
ncbi:MAG TPA: response regulator [Verrucomicrobiae bacterium]|nr:response regulator [Verrucomicrobiae bacterium]